MIKNTCYQCHRRPVKKTGYCQKHLDELKERIKLAKSQKVFLAKLGINVDARPVETNEPKNPRLIWNKGGAKLC